MAKNILITGANGQLGNEMRKILTNNASFYTYFTDVAELDITNLDAINNFVSQNNINIIINCAAYTAVDLAEDNKELCNTINHIAVANLAQAAKTGNAKLIHISTDYVFDGTSCHPYTEDDKTCPQSVYGSTKLEGEKALAEILPNDHIIVRTAWLYSAFGKNFVKTMLTLGTTKESLNVVADQVGTPTYAGDLANAIYTIICAEQWVAGTYHFSNEGVCSWYDFTKMIHKTAGITSCQVNPISTGEYPAKAARPAYSVLDKSKIKRTFSVNVPYWLDSLEKCISEIKNN